MGKFGPTGFGHGVRIGLAVIKGIQCRIGEAIRAVVKEDLAGAQADDSIGVFPREVDLMQADHDGDAILLADAFKQVEQAAGGAWIEAGDGFIREQNLRLLA